MITDSAYRHAFVNFHSLHKVKGVLFGLSGSIPPSLYPKLCEITAMTWKVLRTPSSRKELKYQVVRVSQDDQMNAGIYEYLQQALKSYSIQDRAMVFCRSKREAQDLSDLFGVSPYFAPFGDGEETRNQDTMKKWLGGEKSVMVSTSILGCGSDYTHVRDVVHRGPAYTMLDQYQEDSRGGRDGLECRATTFIVENKQYPINQSPYDLGTKELHDSLKERTMCLRRAVTTYLDGRANQCITLPGAAFCGNCTSLSSLDQSPPRRMPDLFDIAGPPHIDLRSRLKPGRRVSLPSFVSSGSTLKRRKLTHTSSDTL